MDDDEKPSPEDPCLGEFENVALTDAEYKKLEDIHGAEKLDRGIEILSAYMKQSGKTYKSCYAAMKKDSWVWSRIMEVDKTAGKKTRERTVHFD